MTKLTEWLFGLTVYSAVWLSLVTGRVKFDALKDYNELILIFPLITVALFGVYAASVVLWRVYNFNDCPEASKELQQQISMAREDLRKKGLDI